MKEKMKQTPNVTLCITEEQFLVLYEFLYNVKLGDNNKWETAISDMLIAWDTENYPQLVARMETRNGGHPEISVLVTQENGMEFHLK